MLVYHTFFKNAIVKLIKLRRYGKSDFYAGDEKNCVDRTARPEISRYYGTLIYFAARINIDLTVDIVVH